MTANDNSDSRQKKQNIARGGYAYQTIRPKGWDCSEETPNSSSAMPPSPKSPPATRRSDTTATILPPPVNSHVHANHSPSPQNTPTPHVAGNVNSRQTDTDPDPANKTIHDTQSPQISDDLSDTIAYHTTAGVLAEQTDSASTTPSTSSSPTWIGESGGLQVRRCGIGGTITGVPQVVINPGRATSTETRVEYSILGVVGRGGMGVVHRARQTTLNRIVAIKSLQTRLARPDTVQRMFVAEALITAGLVHPNIVPLHDMGVDDQGRLFYSMKLVSGKTLQDMIPVQSLETNLEVLLKVCDAVAYAHSRGVINRDLKPENVIVGDFGEVVVLDWGVAVAKPRFAAPNNEIRFPQSAAPPDVGPAGTPAYIAPELLEEETSRVCPASDVYLLGAILYEILEGFPPHVPQDWREIPDSNEKRSVVIQAAMDNYIEPGSKNSGELMQIAQKAMQTHPEDRFQSVEEFQEAIRQYRITGRAEELLVEAKNVGQSRYDEYQQSVALFANAIKQWKDNQRAQQGNVQAREAFAELALKRGDYDLGLEVVAGANSHRLQQLEKNLKRSRLQRKIIRATWVLFGGAAAILLALTVIARMSLKDLSNTKKELENDISNLKLQEEDLKSRAADAEVRAAEADQKVEAAKTEAAQVKKAANDQKIAAEELAKKEQLRAEVAVAKADEAEAKAKAEMEKANMAIKTAELAKDTADKAEKLAAESQRKAAEQQVKTTLDRLEALHELREWHQLYNQATSDINDESLNKNPFFNDAKKGEIRRYLNKARNEAKLPNTNTRRELPGLKGEADTLIAMSDNGEVLAYVVSNGNRDSRLEIVTAEYLQASEPQNHIQVLPLEPRDYHKNRCSLTLSPQASSLCLLTPTTKAVYRRDVEGRFQPLELPDATWPKTPNHGGFARFTNDQRYLFVIGSDKRSSIQILDLQSDTVRPLLPPDTTLFLDELANHTCTHFAILPDGSGLLHYSADAASQDARCRFFPVTWTNGVPALPTDADDTGYIEATILTASPGAPGLQQPRIGLLEVTPDGQLLIGLDGRDSHAITLAPRKPDTPQLGQFPFSVGSADSPLPWFRSRERQLPRIVRVGAGGKTIIGVRAGLKRDNLEIWTLNGQNVAAAAIRGTERFAKDPAAPQDGQPALGTIVSGQSSSVLALSVPTDSEAGRIFFAADSRGISRWNLDTWHQLPDMADEVLQQFKDAAAMQKQAARFGRAIFAALPAPQQTGDSDPPTQQSIARFVYSAELSPDGSSIIVGTNELDARALRADNLNPLNGLNLRPDPLAADPSATEFQEGHKSNIAAIRFLPPNGEFLVTSENLGVISIWDAVPDSDGIGREKSRLITNLGTAAFAISSDGSLILAGGADLARSASGREVPVYQGMLWKTADALNSVAPQPAMLLRINPEIQDQLLRRQIKSSFQITATAISKDNRLGVTGGRRGELVFWSLADGSVRAFERTHGGDQISAMFFDADGRLVTAGYDGQVIRWTLNEDSLTPSQQSLYKGRQILQMETSPDGAFVALCELSPAPTAVPGAQPNSRRPSLLQFNILDASGKLLKKLSEIEVPVATPTLPFETGFAWSADGARLLVVSGGKLTFRKTADWSVEKSFVVERTSNSQRNANAESVEKQRPARAAFSPSSSNLLATLNQREAHLWDIEKNTHLAEFRTHHSRRLTASWSADQRLMLTASDAIRVFDADPASPNRGQTLLRIPVSSGDSPLAYARFSPVPGDLRFLSGNEAGNVLLYRCTNTGALEGSPVPFPAAENNPLPEAAAALASLRFPSSARWSGDGKLCALIRNGELSCWKTDEQTPQPIPIKNPEGFPPLRCNDLVIAKDGDSLLLAAAGLAWIDDSDQLLPAAAFWKLNAQNEFVQVGLLLDDKRHFGDQQALDDVEQDLPPGITAIGFDSLSRTIFTGGRDGRVFEWAAGDFTSDQPTREFLGLSKEANAADVKRGENLFTRVISLQVAADGRLIAADSTGNILIWPPVPK